MLVGIVCLSMCLAMFLCVYVFVSENCHSHIPSSSMCFSPVQLPVSADSDQALKALVKLHRSIISLIEDHASLLEDNEDAHLTEEVVRKLLFMCFLSGCLS